ncbi:hypothetical protein ACIGXF_32560 [Streptomyces sp. NPDC053086]|uniref:hypothetical protein n=1 Tax=unclassified Streptomyces TaxID=2593676 RepID=UPI0037D8C942
MDNFRITGFPHEHDVSFFPRSAHFEVRDGHHRSPGDHPRVPLTCQRPVSTAGKD